MKIFNFSIRKIFVDALNLNNPVTIQTLGICSALAVTTKMKPAIVMALSLTFVAAFSNLIISLLRNTIPLRIRIIVQLTVIATLVILVDQFLKAFAYDISKQLSVFVGLIITNCIVMGRLETFGMVNKPLPSFFDGLANGAGYGLILIVVSFFREFFGYGTIIDINTIPKSLYHIGYLNNSLFIIPPMALILIGIIIWVQKGLLIKRKK